MRYSLQIRDNLEREKENQMTTYTLSAEQEVKLAKYRELAAAAKRDGVQDRATDDATAISFNLDFGLDEQIRRFEKQVKDAQTRTATAAKAALYEKILACNGDAEKIAEVLAEAAKVGK